MAFRHSSVSGVVLFLLAACSSNSQGPALPSPSPSPTATQPAQSPSPQTPANGRFTWTSIVSSRTLCGDITRQVGQSWPLWFSMVSDGDAVTISLSEGPADPLGDGPAIFRGTRSGDTISASRSQANLGGLACPGDGSITPEVGGDLTATLAGNEISGQYTAIYGAGANQVTLLFGFGASLSSGSNESRR